MWRRTSGLWVVVVLLVIVPSAWAITLSPTPSPLPGNTFQAADGDQAAPTGLTDWASEQAAGDVTHAPDPNDHDSAFTGGSEEDQPGKWDLTTEAGGVNPAKVNIRDAWGTVQDPANRTFLNLAFSRETSEGTAFLTFELNRAGRLWNNGHAEIPCRTTGDLLITYEPRGNTVNVVIQRWVTTKSDPDSACASEGRLVDAKDLTANVDVQGALNGTVIANSLPGAYDATIPTERFGEAGLDLAAALADGFDDRCFAFTSVWMHSRSSDSEASNMQDYIAPERLQARRCSASGTKFFDRNANGVRDEGEPGLPRFVIFADYNDNGKRDSNEPFAVTDDHGRYVIDDIRPPDGTYTLRETLLPGGRTHSWRCSYPGAVAPGRLGCGHGPIDVSDVPFARGRDFGDWFPARLRVVKRLYPANDPGRFALSVNGRVAVPAAGNGDSRTLRVPPGTYDVSEAAVPPTDPANYTSSVECKRGTRGAIRRRGTASSVTLLAGDRAVCIFRNVRGAAPAIAIDKSGPATAEAGSTLHYTLRVENIGSVPIPATSLDVTDEGCDAPPVLQDKSGDTSPDTFDPGDIWVYTCSRNTKAPGRDCVVRTVTNAGEASGTANGTTVRDSSTISTVLTCPDQPTPPGPGPDGGGGDVAPPGPKPPNAGSAGEAVEARIPSCLRRGSRVTLRLSRVASVRLSVGGETIRGVKIRPLQRRVVFRVRNDFAPGRYRVTAFVRYQRGAGTAPVRLTRTVRVCGRPRAVACRVASLATAEARASCVGERPRRRLPF